MYSKVMTINFDNLKGQIIEVEASIRKGMVAFFIGGKVNFSMKESKERIKSAFKNSLIKFPHGNITVNLSPANFKKQGTHFDLPIAVSILSAKGLIIPDRDTVFIGELNLEGKLMPIKNPLKFVKFAKDNNYKRIILPKGDYGYISIIKGLEILYAIIQPEQFDYIQAEIARRENDGRGSGLTIFSNKVKCGKCGAWYGLKTWHSNDEYRREIYRCNDKYKTKGKPCKSPHLTEAEIKDIFIKAVNKFVKVRKTVAKEISTFIDTICTTTDLEVEANKLKQDLENIIFEMESIIRENAKTIQNQEEYLQRENKIRLRYSELNSKLAEVENEIKIKQNRKTMLENFIKTLDGISGEITEFDEDLWSGLLDYILIKEKEHYTVVFKNGTEVDT